MTEPQAETPTAWQAPAMRARLRRRYRSEWLFRAAGLAALGVAAAFLLFLLADIVSSGWSSFLATDVRVELVLSADELGVTAAEARADPVRLQHADFQTVVQRAASRAFGNRPVVSEGAWVALRRSVAKDPSLIGRRGEFWLLADSRLDQWKKRHVDAGADTPLFQQLDRQGRLRVHLNGTFLSGADSVDPEMAGIWGGLKGSFLTMLVTLLLSVPVGVLAAIYLEEFSTPGRRADFLEVSINNLAAVPSIIFGLLGLAVFLNVLHMPRAAPLVGGMTLALMTLPVIVISSRAALKAVPPSIRSAALGVGASPVQVVFHHVLPLAVPGILTGSILGLARALGETAPLLLIGMRAFLTTVPDGLMKPATLLPVQVFLWSDNINRGFVEKTSGAILVLLVFLLSMNGIAIHLRNRFEVRW